MTATSALQVAAASLQLSQEESRSIVTGGQLQQLYASWQAVFAHSHAVDNFHVHAQPDGHRGPRSAHEGSFRPGFADPDDESTAASWTTRRGAAAATSGTGVVPESEDSPSVLAQTAVRIAMGTRQGAADPRVRKVEARPEEAAGTRPGAINMNIEVCDESVKVFVRDAQVEIVVRDSELSASEAVTCGFETAQQLTGERDCLQRLTLNGRSIYERTSRSPADTISDLIFAC